MKRITIKDVAEAAGVSPSAVSRVFTDGASASAETRARVQEAADRLGYRPSRLARGLTGNRTNLITVVYGGIQDPFDALVLETLSQALSRQEMQLMLLHAGHDDAVGKRVLAQSLDYSSDAIILTAGTVNDEQMEICTRAGLPVVVIGRDPKAKGVDAVLADNYAGGQKMAELFLRHGCARPAFLSKATPTWSNGQRMAGFSDRMKEAGLETTIATANSEMPNDTFHAASGLLFDGNQPDAVFCSNDFLAFRLLEAANLGGLHVPEDVIVAGFNDIPQAALPAYRLTSLKYDPDEIVHHVLTLLERRLSDPDASSQAVTLSPELILRNSSSKRPGKSG